MGIDYCFEYIEIIKTINDNNQVSEIDPRKEALKEKTSKILINSKEEWRSVLPYIPRLMSASLDVLKQSNSNDPSFEMIMDLLRNLSICISPKRLAKYWPTDLDWLIKVTQWLEDMIESDSKPQNFSSVYTLILWLASAIHTPFALDRFVCAEEISISPRIHRIISKCADNYSLYPVLHFLCGAFFSRIDCQNMLNDFINNLLLNLNTTSCINSKLCTVRILATLMKKIPREIMLRYESEIYSQTIDAIDFDHEKLVKLSLKLIGRCALVYLKPSENVSWRYRCGKRAMKPLSILAIESKPIQSYSYLNDCHPEKMDLPNHFENMIRILLKNLANESTIVRFTVAKYLASICDRLTEDRSDQVINHVLQLCSSSDNDDNLWHGCCLTLAEIVRRGYFKAKYFPDLVEILEKAFFFEKIKGSFVCGENIRDAACYICWSLVRSYDCNLIDPFVNRLASLLINVVCFDKAINCRRAASAVIQELAGRARKFPNWIDVIQRTGFHDLNSIERTFLEIGVHFATSYAEFRPTIINHLLFNKSLHFDHSIRQLAAQAIRKISLQYSFATEQYFLSYFSKFKNLSQEDYNTRHGLILTIAFLLGSEESLQTFSTMDMIYEILFNLKTSRLVAISNSNNLIKESYLVFIKENLKLYWRDTDKRRNLYSFILTTLESNESDESIQSHTILALNEIRKLSNESDIEALIDELIDSLEKHDQFIVSTIARFLSECNLSAISVNERILIALNKFLNHWFKSELRRPETIGDVITALLKTSVHHPRLFDESKQSNVLLEDIHRNVLKCLKDHSITKKGDTGLIVRFSVLKNIDQYARLISTKKLCSITKLIAAEAASHRYKTFVLSMKKLFQIASNRSESCAITSAIKKIFNRDDIFSDDDFENKLDLFDNCIHLLDCPQIIEDLWLGFVSILADPGLEKFSNSLIDYIQANERQETILAQFAQVAQKNAKDPRLCIPFLIGANLLLTRIPTTDLIQTELASFAWNACAKTSNPKKYLLSCDIFCTLVSIEKISLAQSYLYVLLGHRLPRVRSYTAIQLYSALLALPTDEIDSQLTVITDHLKQTDWLDLETAKEERQKVRSLLHSIQ
ncbi:60S ribosomal protein L14 [Sarcoptes scabiei]|nr:60S ribosomal protein L14 [Sarcoptes scabiei]